MYDYKCLNKLKRNEKTNKNYFIKILNICLVATFLLILNLILCKNNEEYKKYIEKNIYNNNLSFGKIETVLEKYFGKTIPKSNKKTELVFNDKLIYKDLKEENGGIKLNIEKNTLINAFESGVVVFNGIKDNYGKTLIIEQIDGNQAWYINLDTSNIKIYDYIEKGKIIGPSITNEITLYFKNKGENVDYKKYIS